MTAKALDCKHSSRDLREKTVSREMASCCWRALRHSGSGTPVRGWKIQSAVVLVQAQLGSCRWGMASPLG